MNHREAAPDGGLLAIQIRLFGVTIPARLPEQPAVAEDIQDRYPLEKFVAHEFPVDQVDKARPKPSIYRRGNYPPAKPGALGLEPLEAAEGVADAAP